MVESERLDIQTIDKIVYDVYGVVLLQILVYAGREKEAHRTVITLYIVHIFVLLFDYKIRTFRLTA